MAEENNERRGEEREQPVQRAVDVPSISWGGRGRPTTRSPQQHQTCQHGPPIWLPITPEGEEGRMARQEEAATNKRRRVSLREKKKRRVRSPSSLRGSGRWAGGVASRRRKESVSEVGGLDQQALPSASLTQHEAPGCVSITNIPLLSTWRQQRAAQCCFSSIQCSSATWWSRWVSKYT